MSLQPEPPIHILGISKGLALKITGGVFLAGIGVKFAYDKGRAIKASRNFDEFRKSKLEFRESQLAEFRQLYPMSPELDKILSLSLSELQDELFKGELSAEDVMKAYIAKSLEVHDKFNCLTELIPNSMAKAKALDKMHMVKGPLHGIPFCLIDERNDKISPVIPDLCTTGQDPSYVVQCLENLGAIAFCRTNPHQTHRSSPENRIMMQDYGEALNPLNKKLMPGIAGSTSGGLAALIAAGGAPFGVGTDVGGSLRISAHFCGISALRPTANRLSSRGFLKADDNLPPSAVVPGILAKRAKDTAVIIQALMDNNLQNLIDGKAVPMSWNAKVLESKQKSRIGFLTSLVLFPPLGDTETVIFRIKTYLESAGHLLIPFQLPESIQEKLSSWNPGGSVKRREVLSSFCGNMWHSVLASGLDDLADEVLDQMKDLDLDLILCPVFPLSAIPIHDMSINFSSSNTYTLIWSLLNFPAGVVKGWTESGRNNKCSEEIQSKFGEKLINILEQAVGDSKGMPIGVQIIGKPFQEELVLRTLVELDEINDP